MAKEDYRKIGEGSFSRMFEHGRMEVGGALYPDSNIAHAAGYRNFWNSGPNEISPKNGLEAPNTEKTAESRDDKDRDDLDKGIERE